jgi:hypothetical protein
MGDELDELLAAPLETLTRRLPAMTHRLCAADVPSVAVRGDL